MAEQLELKLYILTNAEMASRKMRQFNRTLDETNNKMGKISKRSNFLMRGFKNLLVGFLGIQGAKSLIRNVRELDLIERSIVGLTKSTEDWDYVQREAFRTGTRIKDVARGYRNFYASANMAGFDKKSIQGMYSDVLTATRSISAKPEQTAGALLALEQMISKGVVSLEELRRQLGNALPGAFEIGAKAMKMTTKEFNEFIKTGQLASAHFVPLFIKQLKREYAGGFKEATKSLDFAMVNLSNSWQMLQVEFTKVGLGKELANAINTLNEGLQDEGFKNLVKALGSILGFVVKIGTFIIKNKEIFGFFFLGGVLSKVKWLNVSFQTFLRFIRMSKIGVLGLNGAFLTLLGTIGRVLLPLLILQDLIYGLFFRDKTKSLTGDVINDHLNGSPRLKAVYDDSNLKIDDLDFFGRKEIERQAKNRRLGKKTLEEKIQDFMSPIYTRMNSVYNSPMTPLTLDKTESKTTSISIGDVHIHKAGDETINEGKLADILYGLFAGKLQQNG